MVKVYKVLKGTKALGARKGMYLIAHDQDCIFCQNLPNEVMPVKVEFGRLRSRDGRWVGDGNPAINWEKTAPGWEAYPYTHGDRVYRERCWLANAIHVRGFPDKLEYKSLVAEAVDHLEAQMVLNGYEASLRPY